MKPFSTAIYDAVQNVTVKYARFNEISEEMDHITTLARDHQRPEGYCVMGCSGLGKTLLLKLHEAKFPEVRNETHLCRPVIRIKMPAKPTEMALLYVLALAFGEQYTGGRSYQLYSRVIKLLKQCRTHTILIDEAQHMVRRKNSDDAKLAADTLKNIMDEAVVSVVLAGVPEVEDILLANKQLRGRFTSVAVYEPWVVVPATVNKDKSEINKEVLPEFSGILCALTKKSGYQGDFSLLSRSDVIRRVYFATDGRIRYMSRLIAATLAVAIPNEIPKLELSHFSKAFLRKIHPRAKPESNPFDDAFVERRLILKGEPFWGDDE